MPIAYDDFMEWKMNGWDIPHHTIASYVRLTVRLVRSRSMSISNINPPKKVAKLITDQEEEFIIVRMTLYNT